MSLAALAGLGRAGYAYDKTDMRAFQSEVLAILKKRFPDRAYKVGADEAEIRLGALRLYLGNLYATVQDAPPERRRAEIIKWIATATGDQPPKPAEIEASEDWTKAQALLRPKLVPKDYVRTYPMLVNRVFSPDLALAYAIDLGNRDKYLLDNLLTKWSVKADVVHERAIANLDDMSTGIAIEPRAAEGGSGHFVAIAQRDAYDADRILLPRLRARLHDALGPRMFAGIPNRDFFVLWSPDFSAREGFVRQISKDARSEPYALTEEIFVISGDDVRVASADESATDETPAPTIEDALESFILCGIRSLIRRLMDRDPTRASRRGFIAAAIFGAFRAAAGARAADAENIIPAGFREEVLALLRDTYPDRPFERDAGNGAALTLGKTKLFLGNLYQIVQHTPEPGRRDDILRWFAQNLAILDKTAADAAEMKVWANAKPHIRPQLVPRAYLDTTPTIAHVALSPEILVISVIDYPDRIVPVQTEDVAAWQISEVEVRDAAIANLDAISRDVAIEFHDSNDGIGRYGMVAAGDTYDAARILLPGLRRRLADRLGASMFAAAPNRSFLIAWSFDYSHRRDFISKVASDTRKRPYPLSAEIFVVTADSVRLARADEVAR